MDIEKKRDILETDDAARDRWARKTHLFRFRGTPLMLELVNSSAKQLGLTPTAFIRGAVEDRVLGMRQEGADARLEENARLRAQLDAVRKALDVS